MRRKSTKIATPTLEAMTVIFRQRGFKRAKGCATVYMKGFNDAKEKYQKRKRQMVLTKRLMNVNKSPRRVNRRAGGRRKKTKMTKLVYSSPCSLAIFSNRPRKKKSQLLIMNI